MEIDNNDTFCVTSREELDIIQVYKDGKQILEVAVLHISKSKVKLGFRASKEYKYTLTRAIEDGIH